MTLEMRIARVLFNRRMALNLTQEIAAEKADLHRTAYMRIEHGEGPLGVSTFAKVCSALRAKPWQILKQAENYSE